jgi:hypothetical protein
LIIQVDVGQRGLPARPLVVGAQPQGQAAARTGGGFNGLYQLAADPPALPGRCDDQRISILTSTR